MHLSARSAPAVLCLAAAPLLAPAPAGAAVPQSYCFAKHAVAAGAWEGTYAAPAADGSCDPSGGLPMRSHLTSAPVVTGQVWHITIVWEFLDARGDLVFQTDQSGLLKLGSGDVVLHGTVTAGAGLGSRTQDRGTPTDALGSYEGEMRVQQGG